MAEEPKTKIAAFLSLDHKRRDWTYRRIIIFGVTVACLVWITWAAGWMRVETANTLISSAFNLLLFLITGYVFAGVADDHLRRTAAVSADPENKEAISNPGDKP
jgi:hypothetical protein